MHGVAILNAFFLKIVYSLPFHTIHSCKGNNNETSKLYHQDLARWDCLTLASTARHMASIKDSQQEMIDQKTTKVRGMVLGLSKEKVFSSVDFWL